MCAVLVIIYLLLDSGFAMLRSFSVFLRSIFCALVFAFFYLCVLLGCGQADTVASLREYNVHIVNPDYVGGLYDAHNNQYVIWGSDGVIATSTNGASWQQYSGGTAYTIRDVSVHENNMLAVGDSNTILESFDGGTSWQSAERSENSSDYLTALIRENGDKLAAGTNGQLLLKPAGQPQWHPVGLATPAVKALIEFNNTLIASGDNGFLATSKNGYEWQVLETNLTSSIGYLVSSSNHVVALAEQGDFLLFDEISQGWRLFDTKVQAPFSAAAFSDNGSELVIAAQNGQIVCGDLVTNTWQPSAVTLDTVAHGVSSVIYSSANKTFLLSGHSGMFATSVDAGKTWQATRVNASYGVQHLLFNTNSGQLVTFGRGGELHLSSGVGQPWQTVQENLSGYYRLSQAFNNHWLALGTVGEVVTAGIESDAQLSNNITPAWQMHDVQYPNPNTPPFFRSLISLPNNHLLAAGPTGAIMKSEDYGKSWRPVLWTPFDNNEAFTQLIYNAFNNSVIAIEAQGNFYISQNSGESWQSQQIQAPHRLWAGDVNPSNGVVVAVGQRGQIAVYNPANNNWAVQAIANIPDLYGSFYSASTQQFYLAGQSGSLIVGSAQGDNWQVVNTGTASALRNVSETPKGALIGFGGNQTILRKPPKSSAWQIVNGGPDGELRSLQVHPQTGQLFVIGSHGLLFSSLDDGVTWERIQLHTQAGFRGFALAENNRFLATGERLVVVDMPANQ